MKLNTQILKALYEAKESNDRLTFDDAEYNDIQKFLLDLGFNKDGNESWTEFLYSYGFDFEKKIKTVTTSGRAETKTISAYCSIGVSAHNKRKEYDIICSSQIGLYDYDRDNYPNTYERWVINPNDQKTMKDFKKIIETFVKFSDTMKPKAEEYIKAMVPALELEANLLKFKALETEKLKKL